MIDILKKENCSGCSACSAACPVKCIDMLPDKEGFLYPKIDKDKCINCGQCEKVCPINNVRSIRKDGLPKSYLAYENDKEIRAECAAGGVFTGIAATFIKKYNGVVFGAVYDEDFTVYHDYTEDIEGLRRFRKSKYVQSDMRDCFVKVKEFLKKGKKVLFSGTTCQIYGLKSYLKHDKPDLYCIDLICYGVPSPKVFSLYLDHMTKKYGEIEKVIVRDKKIYKKYYQMGYGIVFKNGYHYFEKHSVDPMARIFYGKISSRPICYKCPFKTMWRVSDLTIGDCWYGSSFIPGYIDNYGITLTLCQSEKGTELLDICDNITAHNVPTEDAAKVNGGMLYSACTENPDRTRFFNDLDNMSFDKLADKYFPVKKEPLRSRVRNFMLNHGILPDSINLSYRNKKVQKMIKSREIPDTAKCLLSISPDGVSNIE